MHGNVICNHSNHIILFILRLLDICCKNIEIPTLIWWIDNQNWALIPCMEKGQLNGGNCKQNGNLKLLHEIIGSFQEK